MGETPSARVPFDGQVIVSRCPACESPFRRLEADVLGASGDRRLVHLRCADCQQMMLALLVPAPLGTLSVGVLTDCTSDDARRFRGGGPIADDDVLELHARLGDGRALLGALRA